MQFRTLAILVGLVSFAAPALAETWDDLHDYSRPGWYVEAGGLGLISSFSTNTAASPSGGGIVANGGYRFNPWYAIHSEFVWGRMSGDSTSQDENVRVSGTATTTSWSIMAAGKIYPMGSARRTPFQPYLKLGAGYGGLDASQSFTIEFLGGSSQAPITNTNSGSFKGFQMKFGAGFEYFVTQRLYVLVDYNYSLSITDEIDGFNFHAIGGGLGFRL